MIPVIPGMGRQGRILLTLAAFAAAGSSLVEARPWQKVVTSRFTLITDASDYASRRLLTDFSDYLGYLDMAMGIDPRQLKPLTLVLFDNDAEYRTYEERLRDGKTVESVATELELYAGSQTGFGPNWATISAVVQPDREGTRGVVFYAGALWYLGSLDQSMPLAVKRGLPSLYSTFERGVTHGIGGKTVKSFDLILQTWPFVPVEKLLLDNDFDAVVARHEYVNFTAESWALMDFLTYSKVGVEHGAFGKFWDALCAGQTPHEALVAALGAEGAANIDLSLRTFIRNPRYKVQLPMGEEKDNHDPYQPASEVDVELALTKAAMISGQYKTAMVHVNAAVAAAKGTPEAYDLRAELLAAHPDGSESPRAAVQAAIEHGSKDAYILCQQARYQWEDAGAVEATPAASRQAVNGAERAANANLNYRPSFDLLSLALRYADHVAPADEKFLAYARQRFPRDRWIFVGIAAFARKQGDLALAEKADATATAANPALDATQRDAVIAFLASPGKKLPPGALGSVENVLPAARAIR